MESLLISNLKVFYEGRLLEGEVAIEGGKILKVGKHSHMPALGEVLDGRGLVALPGLIDVHVHLRDMYLSYKEDFYSGTCAAAAGGFTTVIDMPNTVPPTNSLHRLEDKVESAREKVIVNIAFHLMPPSNLSEIEGLVRAGAKSFKIYLGGTYLKDYDPPYLRKVIKACERLKFPLTVHAEGEDPADEKAVSASLKKSWGIPDYLNKHSILSEVAGMRMLLQTIGDADPFLHFCHISSGAGLQYTLEAFKNFSTVIREVTPHHLFLTQKVFKTIGRSALMNPPVRDSSNRRSLWKGLVKGQFDLIASDHAPHSLIEKERSNVREVPPGIPGLETTLPLLLTEVNKGTLPLSSVVDLLSRNPASIYRFTEKGEIREGFDADLVVVDLKERHRINPEKFHSKAKYTPFENWECMGKPVKTLVSGRLVMDEGEIQAEKGSGQIVL